MKIAYHYDYKTLIYKGESQIHKTAGYDEYILPQFSTWVAKPAFDEETEQAKFDVKNQKWIVELKPVEVTAYHKQTQESKVFDDVSLVTDEYTLEKLLTQWDEWINDAWVTNESNKYIAEYNQVDDARRAAYFQVVTPLIDEAKIKRDLIKTPEAIAEADELEQQALAARQKIQTENPWPTPPTN
ncbi:Tail fiber assembly protein [Vibrio crassostreae]|nr:Tail fiber assembly protein [Vibrio crassostreae]